MCPNGMYIHNNFEGALRCARFIGPLFYFRAIFLDVERAHILSIPIYARTVELPCFAIDEGKFKVVLYICVPIIRLFNEITVSTTSIVIITPILYMSGICGKITFFAIIYCLVFIYINIKNVDEM